MTRRDLLALLGAVAAWPLGAAAQQAKMPVVGFLGVGTPESYAAQLAAWRKGLGEADLIEGRNVVIEYRLAAGNEQLPALAAELVSRRVDVIQTASGGAAQAVKAFTSNLPIVFIGAVDPVAQGLVKSIQRPGGNITGVAGVFEPLVGKRLQLLREVVPSAARIGYLVNPANINAGLHRQQGAAAAQALGIEIAVLTAATPEELDPALAAGVRTGMGGLLVAEDAFLFTQHRRLPELAARHALPAVYPFRDFAEDGGLVSYSYAVTETYYQAGVYVSRILMGEKPGELPIQQPTRFELVINLKTAKALGLTIPPALLARADEVID